MEGCGLWVCVCVGGGGWGGGGLKGARGNRVITVEVETSQVLKLRDETQSNV